MKENIKELEVLAKIFEENIYTRDLKNYIDESYENGKLNLSGWSLGVTLEDKDLSSLVKYISLKYPLLEKLDLSNNVLKTLPDTIGDFKKLGVLNLNNNELS